MSPRAQREDVSVDERAAETFVPRPTEPTSGESQPAEALESPATERALDTGSHPLSERERAVLTFEKQPWKHSGAKDQAIRDRFELSPTHYYQLLNSLLDRPEAQEFEPALVKRLRRIRAAKQRARSGRAHPHPA